VYPFSSISSHNPSPEAGALFPLAHLLCYEFVSMVPSIMERSEIITTSLLDDEAQPWKRAEEEEEVKGIIKKTQTPNLPKHKTLFLSLADQDLQITFISQPDYQEISTPLHSHHIHHARHCKPWMSPSSTVT